MWIPSLKQVSSPLSAVALQLVIGSVALAVEGGEEHLEHGYEGISADLAFWGIIAFIGFLVALKFLGWDSLTSGMKAREHNERQMITDAEQLRAEAASQLLHQKGQLESFDEQVREILAEAERDTVSTREGIVAVAQSEANTLQKRAEVEIGRTRDQSLNELFDTMATRVADQTEQRIREKLNDDAQQKLIDEAVADFVGSSK